MTEFNIGDTFHHPAISGSPLCHIRGLVDDQIVFRWWKRSKQRWEYQCEPAWLLRRSIEWSAKL